MPQRDPARRHPLRLLRSASARLLAEATELAGSPPVEVEPLQHGHRFSTGGVWRVRWSGSSAVVKVISGDDSRPSSSFRWWRREAVALAGNLPAPYAEAGLRAPHLLRLVERFRGETALWQEDVAGSGDLVEAAAMLGRAQAAAAERADWWSEGFLRDYLAEWDADLDWSILESDEAWEAPLVRDCWSPDFRSRLRRFHALRPRLLHWLDQLPKTFCHLDFWPPNIAAGGVLLDWAFAGLGVPGEDIGNLLPDTGFDLIQPAATMAELTEPVLAAYAEAWPDPRVVRLGMLASSVKYVWLPVTMLAQAGATEHAAYGGNYPADSAHLYRERGQVFEMLFDWADEAERLAAELALG